VPACEPDFFRLLEVLGRHGVDYILVGGLCAVLQGVPLSTLDMDIVHLRTAENLDRLLGALQELQAVYRHHAEQRLAPDRSHLASAGHQLLQTAAGPLDVLGTIGNARGYAELIDQTQEIEIEGCRLRLLTLEELIRTKEEAGRDKDQASLPLLRQALLLQQTRRPP